MLPFGLGDGEGEEEGEEEGEGNAFCSDTLEHRPCGAGKCCFFPRNIVSVGTINPGG